MSDQVVCLRIDTEKHHYVYDAYSNQILELTDEEADMVDVIHDPHPVQAAHLTKKWGDVQASTRLASFRDECLRKGVLQPLQAAEVEVFAAEDTLIHQLEHHLQTLVLEVTQQCSLRCRYCIFGGSYSSRRPHSNAAMSFGTAKRAIDCFLARCSHTAPPLNISFYGGEPLLKRSLLSEIMDYVRTKTDQCAFHLTTNGIALNSKPVCQLLADNRVSVTVSLDGPAEIHDRYRVLHGEQGTHAPVEAGLRQLLRDHPAYYREYIRFNAVVVDHNSRTLVEKYFSESQLFAASTRGLRVSGVEANGLQESSDLTKHLSQLAPRASEHRMEPRPPWLEQSQGPLKDELESALGRIAQRNIGPPGSLVKPSGYCLPGVRKLLVAVDGTFGMCEKVGAGIPIGTLDEGFDVTACREVLQRLTRMWKPECRFCLAQRLCGTCPAEVYDGSTIKQDLFDAVCCSNQQAFARGLRNYVEIAEEHPQYIEYLQNELVLT